MKLKATHLLQKMTLLTRALVVAVPLTFLLYSRWLLVMCLRLSNLLVTSFLGYFLLLYNHHSYRYSVATLTFIKVFFQFH